MALLGVTGASGFVGRHLVAALLEEGHSVRALVRSEASASLLPPEVERKVVGAVDSRTDWSRSLDGLEAIIHLAARVHVMEDASHDPLTDYREVNVAGSLRLAEAAADVGVKRLVFVSSIKVNGESTDSVPFSETSVPAPRDPYGVSKWEAEQELFEAGARRGLEIVVLRPPLMYGPAVRANFLRLLDAIGRGTPLPVGAVRNRRSLLFVRNFADVLARCALEPAAAGQTFLVSDGPAVSSAELARAVGSALGRSPRLLPVPPALLRLAGRLTGRGAEIRRILGSLEVDDRRIRSVLGWTPRYDLDAGLAETAHWWRVERGL